MLKSPHFLCPIKKGPQNALFKSPCHATITALFLFQKKRTTKHVIQVVFAMLILQHFFCPIKYDQLNTLFMSLTNVKITALSLSHKKRYTKCVIQITLPCYNHRTFFVPKKKIHKTRYSRRLMMLKLQHFLCPIENVTLLIKTCGRQEVKSNT